MNQSNNEYYEASFSLIKYRFAENVSVSPKIDTINPGLYSFKMETAKELGVNFTDYNGNLTSR